MSGSSPPTRGAQEKKAVRLASEGLIPAYAGSTHVGRTENERATAHPRLRGEHLFLATREVRCLGSSPPTRGAPQTGNV